jgi:hypothetical protein
MLAEKKAVMRRSLHSTTTTGRRSRMMNRRLPLLCIVLSCSILLAPSSIVLSSSSSQAYCWAFHSPALTSNSRQRIHPTTPKRNVLSSTSSSKTATGLLFAAVANTDTTTATTAPSTRRMGGDSINNDDSGGRTTPSPSSRTTTITTTHGMPSNMEDELESIEFPPPLSAIDRLKRAMTFYSTAVPIVANYYGLIGNLKLQELLGTQLTDDDIEVRTVHSRYRPSIVCVCVCVCVCVLSFVSLGLVPLLYCCCGCCFPLLVHYRHL